MCKSVKTVLIYLYTSTLLPQVCFCFKCDENGITVYQFLLLMEAAITKTMSLTSTT